MNIHQHIIAGIREQLYLNDYLVLPEFGGFVLKTRGASYSISGQMLMPARKTLGFNAQLKQNDGILTNWLQEKLQCDKQEAIRHLSDFAVFCSSVLQSKRRLSLNGIGFFYLDFENNICFEPEQEVNFNTESFGLSALQLVPLTLESEPEKTIHRQDRVITAEPAIQTKTRRSFPYKQTAYLTVFVMSLSFFLIFLVNNQPVNGLLKSTLFHSTSKALYSPQSYPELKLNLSEPGAESFVADNNGIASFPLNAKKNIAVNVYDNQAKANSSNSNLHLTCKYEIILGCFKKLKNAKRLQAQLKKDHIMASIKEKSYKGMHVVSVIGINDKIEAIDQLEIIQANYPKAWMKVN